MSSVETWAGTYTFTAPRLLEARSVAEVQAAVAAGGRVRALGTRHSFNDLADTTGTLVTVTQIPAEPVLDEAARTVTVGAGTRYGVLATWLEERGWALHNLGSLPHISIGGAIATGTHGSGWANGSLSTAVTALTYVDARAELVTIGRGDDGFDGLVVGLGAYGVVVRVALEVQPTYAVRQDVFHGLPWEALLDDVGSVLGAGYSVSVFTTWAEPTLDQVWRKTRLAGPDDEGGVPETWFGVPRDRSSEGRLVAGSEENLTPQGGIPGPWSQRLPHFRLDSTPSNGDEIQTEYFVDRRDAADAIRAVRALADRIAPVLLITELRTVAADDLWLSPAYQRDVLAIHFTWQNRPDDVRALLPAIEAALAPFGARPHWGKFHGMGAEDVRRVTPRLDDARALFERLDPGGVFTGAHLMRLGLREPR
ncbi:D-arabinono-1,4-lactone oxidase [Cellulomonas edaphi]|uniref:FAD-binding protein n=1 Tax=Cellulomonas edaphi TaxID=3053468 RepID=A0ABT7S9I0_9CELL|nr:D-arabinono-1,4-lactone oxidase [Cellulomons edaphi]MDM7832283.1 FAD-binding protein [Cellulomons edaphi]